MKESYTVGPHGIISLVTEQPLPIKDYRHYYDSLGQANTAMSLLRLGLITREIVRGDNINDIELCDVGPGNGEFLRCCSRAGFRVAYHDVLPGATQPYTKLHIDEALSSPDIVTLFDSLEHIQDLIVFHFLHARWAVVTVPCCPTDDPASEAFLTWHHRKPEEHYHHFTPLALEGFFAAHDYSLYYLTHIEDALRPSQVNSPNTMTAIFRRNET